MRCSNSKMSNQDIIKYVDGFWGHYLRHDQSAEYALQSLSERTQLCYDYHGLFFKDNLDPCEDEYEMISDREIIICIWGLACDEGIDIIMSFEELYNYLIKAVKLKASDKREYKKCKKLLKSLKHVLFS